MASKRSYTRLEFTKEEEEQIIDFVKQNPLFRITKTEHLEISYGTILRPL